MVEDGHENQSSASLILQGGETDSKRDDLSTSVMSTKSVTKVTPLTNLMLKRNNTLAMNTSGVLRKLKEAVANKIASKAVKPLEKQSQMRDTRQYPSPSFQGKLARMMAHSMYDIILAVLCCLFSLELVSLIIMDDYIELESSANGFKYAQYSFFGLFLLDNILNFLAYRKVYYLNDPYVFCEMGAILVCLVFVYFDDYTA